MQYYTEIKSTSDSSVAIGLVDSRSVFTYGACVSLEIGPYKEKETCHVPIVQRWRGPNFRLSCLEIPVDESKGPRYGGKCGTGLSGYLPVQFILICDNGICHVRVVSRRLVCRLEYAVAIDYRPGTLPSCQRSGAKLI